MRNRVIARKSVKICLYCSSDRYKQMSCLTCTNTNKLICGDYCKIQIGAYKKGSPLKLLDCFDELPCCPDDQEDRLLWCENDEGSSIAGWAVYGIHINSLWFDIKEREGIIRHIKLK